jgi:hypothetical protein
MCVWGGGGYVCVYHRDPINIGSYFSSFICSSNSRLLAKTDAYSWRYLSVGKEGGGEWRLQAGRTEPLVAPNPLPQQNQLAIYQFGIFILYVYGVLYTVCPNP